MSEDQTVRPSMLLIASDQGYQKFNNCVLQADNHGYACRQTQSTVQQSPIVLKLRPKCLLNFCIIGRHLFKRDETAAVACGQRLLTILL